MSCCGPSESYVLDREIDMCMDSLYEIQQSLKSDSPHKHRESGLTGDDAFAELKSQILARLHAVRTLLGQLEDGEGEDGDPQVTIRLQAAARENMRQLGSEYRELEAQYDASSRRGWSRVSKVVSGELADKKALLDHLAGEIEEVKKMQKRQYMKGYQGGNTRVQTMADAPLFSSPEREQMSSSSLSFSDVTASQKQALLSIKEREAAFEDAIIGIGRGVDDLKDLAVRQNEEVKMQNVLLSDMADRMDLVSSKMANVNSRMKEALRQAGRGDKIWMDLLCVVLALGLAGVAWNEFKMNKYI
mmetsp:Transcript_12076/g.24529  ORF Transcript_12076/g.24529 Transcript_12076/m.24529 type:complete len:302 (+) Transcript_12076:114-1019(+)